MVCGPPPRHRRLRPRRFPAISASDSISASDISTTSSAGVSTADEETSACFAMRGTRVRQVWMGAKAFCAAVLSHNLSWCECGVPCIVLQHGR